MRHVLQCDPILTNAACLEEKNALSLMVKLQMEN